MGRVISARVLDAEWRQIRRQQADAGVTSLAEYIRIRLGLPARMSGLDQNDELADIGGEKALPLLVKFGETLDRFSGRLSQIERHLGVPPLRDREPKPRVEDPAAAADGAFLT